MKLIAACRPDGVVQYTSTVQDDVEHVALEGMTIVELDGPLDGPRRLVDGVLVPFTPEVPLERLKSDKWEAIKAARDRAEFGGFVWDGARFDSDAASQSRIQGAAQLATLAKFGGQPFSVDWTLADNSVRALSGDDMVAVGEAMGVHIMSVHALGRELRTTIEAASAAELEATAWPE